MYVNTNAQHVFINMTFIMSDHNAYFSNKRTYHKWRVSTISLLQTCTVYVLCTNKTCMVKYTVGHGIKWQYLASMTVRMNKSEMHIVASFHRLRNPFERLPKNAYNIHLNKNTDNYSKTCLRDHLSSETTSHVRPQFQCTNSFSYIFHLSSETTL